MNTDLDPFAPAAPALGTTTPPTQADPALSVPTKGTTTETTS